MNNYCSAAQPTDCNGQMKDCPRCGDQVCEIHQEYGLCLACQRELGEITRKLSSPALFKALKEIA